VVGVIVLLVGGVVGVVVGLDRWRDAGLDLVVSVHVAIAILCVFGSVVLLAAFRRDVTRKRGEGTLVRTRLLDLRTVTGVALSAWAVGIIHVALVAYELSANPAW
jgi:hypothetical protein